MAKAGWSDCEVGVYGCRNTVVHSDSISIRLACAKTDILHRPGVHWSTAYGYTTCLMAPRQIEGTSILSEIRVASMHEMVTNGLKALAGSLEGLAACFVTI